MSKKLGFPEGFFWGAATAAYQVEGGIHNTDWAKAGRDGIVPEITDGPDHYNRYEEDFDLAKSLGHNAHRMGVEWARIEPEEGKFDEDAIEHYRKVLKALKKRGLEPFVTLWHFTLPQWMADKGGATSRHFPKYFARYCKFVVNELHDDCHRWATMNEPNVFASLGWLEGVWAPFKKRQLFKMLWVNNNLVKSHIAAYRAIKECDLVTEVGIVKQALFVHSDWKPWNKFAAWVMNWFWNHSFLWRIKNHLDSIGMNYYQHSHFGKQRTERQRNDMGWEIYPEGIYYCLLELKKYKKPMFVSEAGIADEKDVYRERYIKDLVYWMYRAIENGVPLKGYMYWSLTDNYEWAEGYEKRFGLIEIDYETKERKIRNSALAYKKICEENALIIDNHQS